MSGTPPDGIIREIKSETESECFEFTGITKPNIKMMNSRAEIDTSPPFGSVKEAVTHFGGSGSWIPLHKLRDAYHGFEDDDIKKVEEQAAELEKDLIVKELETLDVLEELAKTKRIVEELKRQLQKDAFKCIRVIPDPHSVGLMSTPIKEMNEDSCYNLVNNHEDMVVNSSPCPTSSPDMILMELKQAKLNLGKTMKDIGVIQTSVESLTKKMKKEKSFLEKTRKRLTSKFAGLSSLEQLNEIRGKPQLKSHAGKSGKRAASASFEVSRAIQGIEQTHTSLKTAEMRLVAAKKMEEAARAAEALALAEINAISGSEISSGFTLPEHEKKTHSLEEHLYATSKSQKEKQLNQKKVVYTMLPIGESNFSKLTIVKKLEEAAAEVRYSKQALEEALNRIENANRKQFEAEEALRSWIPEHDQEGRVAYDSTRLNTSHLVDNFPDVDQENDDIKPVLRTTISMRDVLSRKQILPEELAVRNQTEGHPERQKVALSQMLQELREDLIFPSKPDKSENIPKQFLPQRKKFGFIHISLPMTKQSKKKAEALNMV